MTDFAVKMKWFEESTIQEKTCIDCWFTFIAPRNNQGRKIRCDACQIEHENESRKGRWENRTSPETELVKAFIQKTIHDCRCGDRGAQNYVDDGGIELWLRALGLDIRPSMSKQIREMCEMR
jgi:hypothetical protein